MRGDETANADDLIRATNAGAKPGDTIEFTVVRIMAKKRTPNGFRLFHPPVE